MLSYVNPLINPLVNVPSEQVLNTYHEGVGVPLTPPISSPNIFCNFSFNKSLSKISNLCNPPLWWEGFHENP